MRRAKSGALSQWFEGLSSGDPMAWGFLWLIIGGLALFGLLAGYILWQKRKEDQADMKKYGRRK